MRKRIVAGNWKMNMEGVEAHTLFNALNDKNAPLDNKTVIIVSPPSIYLSEFSALKNPHIHLAAQNCSEHENGARTGDISASMLASINVDYCLVGHSERRQYYNEVDSLLKEKVDRLLDNNVSPIFCCGENLPEREQGRHFEVIQKQIENALFHLSDDEIKKITIAYEPIWAIGTGKTASAEQAQEVHAYIRSVLTEKYSSETSNQIAILYGGSCKPGNAKELFFNKDVDGGLIGGAALNFDSFSSIINAF